MFVFSFGVLSATRREHGHLVQDSRIQRSIGLLDLGRTKAAFVSRRFGATTDRRQDLQKAATRWTTQNIATEPIAYSGTSSAPAQRCGVRRDKRRHEGNLSYFNADTISCLTNR